MNKIQVLDPLIADQIAAGEVVERPASIVKELVENSIDSGSDRIDVTIEEGGIASIRVRDNGSGIATEDLEKAFARHATSKIQSGKDLFQIRSLGFRGEALPSIAAVAKVTCISATDASGAGRELVIEGGSIRSNTLVNAPAGTDIIVRDIFYNTPARLKYIKTMQTEFGHISDYMYRMALARPKVAFSLSHNGNLIFRTIGNGDLLQVAAAIYGTTQAQQLIHFEAENLDFSVKGLVSHPQITRSNRSAVTMVVNGRYIRNYALTQAVVQAYHTLLPIHRFPLAVVHIAMEPTLLDVNVHPSKWEVRFSKEKELMDFLSQAIKDVLNQQVLIPQYRESTRSRSAPDHRQVIQEQLAWYPPRAKVVEDNRAGKAYESPRAKMVETSTKWRQTSTSDQLSTWLTPPAKSVKDRSAFPKLYPIGQLKATYIVAQNEDGLYLIDQHAAHERIHYEYFYEQFAKPEATSQELLVPITLEFTPSDAQTLIDRLPLLAQAGVHLEHFGGGAYLVRSYPHWVPSDQAEQVIDEMVQMVIQEQKQPDIALLRDQSAMLCACKASIKANDYQSMQEMEALIEKLSKVRNPYTCPHGRPIIVSFSNHELAKMFKRV